MDLSGLDAHSIETIREAIAHAFVVGFRTVVLICAGLAVASAAAASLMIPTKIE
jgi:hypothetical protein